MLSSAFFGLVSCLYYICFVLLAGFVLFIVVGGRQRAPERSQIRGAFLLLALSLVVWQLTLFLEARAALPEVQIWLSRLNFAAIAVAVYFALRFVLLIPITDGNPSPHGISCLVAETSIAATISLMTPLVDAAERVESGIAISTYGVLFPIYLLHVFGYLIAAVVFAFRHRRHTESSAVKGQLGLVGGGILTTGGIAAITNAVLPYTLDDFRFCDVGTLSTMLFVLAVAYATFIHRLFDLRYIIRETLVYGVMLAFVLGAYMSAVFVGSQYLTAGAGKATQFVVFLIAFSFDPLRRYLERKVDRYLFGHWKTKH